MWKSSPEGARSRQIAEINDLSASGRRVPMGGARMGKSSPPGARSRRIAKINDLSASGRRVPRGAPE